MAGVLPFICGTPVAKLSQAPPPMCDKDLSISQNGVNGPTQYGTNDSPLAASSGIILNRMNEWTNVLPEPEFTAQNDDGKFRYALVPHDTIRWSEWAGTI